MSLEKLLKMKVISQEIEGGKEVEISPDFRIAVQDITEEGVRIIVHPFGYSGETLDFIVSGNELKSIG